MRTKTQKTEKKNDNNLENKHLNTQKKTQTSILSLMMKM